MRSRGWLVAWLVGLVGVLAALALIVLEYGVAAAAVVGTVAALYGSFPAWVNLVFAAPSGGAEESRPREPPADDASTGTPATDSQPGAGSGSVAEPDEMLSAHSLRQFVAAALTDGQITDLAYDHFRPAYEQYAAGMSRDDKARRLVEYASLQRRDKDLERRVAKVNPGAYEEWLRRLRDESDS